MTLNHGGGVSAPPFPRQSGPVLVCGAAVSLIDDLVRARGLFPDAPAIAVNGAAAAVPAFALFTMHPRKLPRWIAQQRGMGTRFTTHAAGRAHARTKTGALPDMSWVDHWWRGIAHPGTSGWAARRMAAAMGFDLVILCGVPLEAGGYFDGGISKVNRSEAAMAHYREAVQADTAHHAGVLGMSGWTARFFGTP